MTKNLVICENLRYPPDEGGSKLAIEFIKSLGKDTIIINFGEAVVAEKNELINIDHRQIPVFGFIFSRLASLFYLINRRPENTYYFPLCAPRTINQFYALIVNILSNNFEEILFQVGDFGVFSKFFSKFKILTFSTSGIGALAKMGLLVERVNIFHRGPNKKYDKQKIRDNYGVDKSDIVALHIGHAELGRGLGVLSALQDQMPKIKIFVVLSSRRAVNKKMFNPKIIFINEYIKDIYELYAMADVYIFPIKSVKSAIDIPLTIIEAKDMLLPIIASDIESSREALGDYPRGFLVKVEEDKKMAQNIKYILEQKL